MDKIQLKRELIIWGYLSLDQFSDEVGWKKVSQTAKVCRLLKLGLISERVNPGKIDAYFEILEIYSKAMRLLKEQHRKVIKNEYTQPGKQNEKFAKTGFSYKTYKKYLNEARNELLNIVPMIR